MWQKIRQLFHKRGKKNTDIQGYTRQQIENAYLLGYNEGKRDGLAIARKQATKSLKEILWEQNQKTTRR